MHTHARPLAVLLLLISFGSCPWAQTPPTAPLNDTGQTLCYDGSAMVACTASNAGNAAAYPSQDGRYGRDAAQAKGKLLPAKTGGGAAGFDFTAFNALDGNGLPVPVDPAPGSHQCVKDNVTGLIWSTENLGTLNWTFANTSYPSSGNTYIRCGYNVGWRLPTRRELMSIVHYGRAQPAIDGTYFPGTRSTVYWTADTNATLPAFAWVVGFDDGLSVANSKTSIGFLRLVRSGQ